MRSNNPRPAWTKLCLVALSLLLGAPAAALGQTHGQVRGPSNSVDGSLGVRCSASAGDSPNIYLEGGVDDDDPRVMVGVRIPLHPQDFGDCRKILAYEEGVSRLAVATSLFERGLITPEQYKEIADEVYQLIKTLKP